MEASRADFLCVGRSEDKRIRSGFHEASMRHRPFEGISTKNHERDYASEMVSVALPQKT